MLGHKLCQVLAGHEVVGLVRKPVVDYEEYSQVLTGVSLVGGVDVLEEEHLAGVLREVRPEFVVNCVGLVKQLEEADDPVLGVAVNSLLPHRLGRLCADIGARLIHISTDCVFDGQRGAYTESDLPNARDFYGRSKALGETLPAETHAVTLRTSFIGRELKANTHGLIEWFLAQQGGAVSGFARVIYSGLTSLELAGVIRRIVDRDPGLTGVHQVASEPISKYDLLMLVREIYDLDIDIRRAEEPISDRSLIMDSFAEATGFVAPSWREMISRMYEDPTPYQRWKQ
ncbi:MAG: SDR family oxidoreductase [bacterium]|nr:SDR family oxidoreductase [bacterium]